MSAKSGRIYVIQREETNSGATLTNNRTIVLNTTDVNTPGLRPGELLLNSMFDSDGNIWFTSGGVRIQEGFPRALGDPPQNSSSIGYVEPSGAICSYHLGNQMIKNSIALSGTDVFAITGSARAYETVNSTGTLSSFSPSSSLGVKVNWQAKYAGGSKRKPGAWSRGSGSSVALLGDRFVAIMDNDDEQIHLLVYDQCNGTLV
jgi:hypothetical protein